MDTNEDAGIVNAISAWTGAPTTLTPQNTAQMAQTVNGSLIFAYQNTSNSNGTLALSSGGGFPTPLQAQAQMGQPSIYVNNWGGNNLQVTNNSTNAAASIWIEAFGIGLPGQTTPTTLTSDGTAVTLTPQQPTPPSGTTPSAQGSTSPQWMTLQLQANAATATVLAIIGGPDSSGNNAYVIVLNSPSTTGAVSGSPVTSPSNSVYATTTQNTYQFVFNWQSGYTIYITNMSASTAANATVSLSPG